MRCLKLSGYVLIMPGSRALPDRCLDGLVFLCRKRREWAKAGGREAIYSWPDVCRWQDWKLAASPNSQTSVLAMNHLVCGVCIRAFTLSPVPTACEGRQ